MIIVEQDGTYFVNLKNTGQITMAVDREKTEYAIIAETLNDNDVVLGIYATEERAKEVLQEIIERLENWENLKAGQPTGIYSPKYVMPKE